MRNEYDDDEILFIMIIIGLVLAIGAIIFNLIIHNSI